MTSRSCRPTYLVPMLLLAMCLSGTVALGAVLNESSILRASNSTHSRLEIILDEEVNVRVVSQLDQTPPYFFIDLYDTTTSFNDKIFPHTDGILRGMRTVSYPDMKVVRLVIYPVHTTTFRVADHVTGYVYPLSDLQASKLPEGSRKTTRIVIDTPKTKTIPLPSLDPIVATGAKGKRDSAFRRLVVIDPGHGGADSGAVSVRTFGGKKLLEKDIVLDVSIEVCRLLNKTPNVSAVLTRNTDKKMSLKERVDFTEKLDADLFTSIHANSTQYHSSATAQGPEFYYFSKESKNETRLLVEAENRAAESDRDPKASEHWKMIEKNLIKDILANNRAEGATICEQISAEFNKTPAIKGINRGVKSAPFRVLMNMTTPATLVEVGFIDHKSESVLLADARYRSLLAKHIANGILAHLAQVDSEFGLYQFAKK